IVGSLVLTPDPVATGGMISLVASGVVDADGEVVAVAFYRDMDGDGAPAPNEQIGADKIGSDGWSLTRSVDWPAGDYIYIARPIDNGNPPLPGNWVSAPGKVRDDVTPPTAAIHIIEPTQRN